MSNRSQLSRGITMGLFAGVAWGVQFPVAGSILEHMHPFFLTFIRYGIASVLFTFILYMSEGWNGFRLDGKLTRVWLLGTLAFTGYNGLVFWGQRMAGDAGPVITSVMMGVMPFVTGLAVWVWKKIRPATSTFVFMTAGAVGVFLVATKGDFGVFFGGEGNLSALLLMLAAVVCWSVYTVGGGSFKGWSALRYTALTCLFGTLSNTIIIIPSAWAGWIASPSWDDVRLTAVPMLYMAAVAGVAAVMSWNRANQLLTPVNAALFINLVPVVSILISIAAGYRIGSWEILGAVLAVTALIAGNMTMRTERIQLFRATKKIRSESSSGGDQLKSAHRSST